MKLLLEFLEDFCYEERLYWTISDNLDQKFEFFWSKSNGLVKWVISDQNGSKSTFNNENIIENLVRLNIDINLFKKAVTSSILTMVCFASSLINQAKSLLSEEIVNNAILDHEDFSSKLLKMLSELEKKKTPKLRILKIED